jgi:hypothetical protein
LWSPPAVHERLVGERAGRDGPLAQPVEEQATPA